MPSRFEEGSLVTVLGGSGFVGGTRNLFVHADRDAFEISAAAIRAVTSGPST